MYCHWEECCISSRRPTKGFECHLYILCPSSSLLVWMYDAPSYRSTRSSSRITLSRSSLASRLKLQIDLIIILLLFCGTVSFWSRCSSRHSFSYIKLACLILQPLFFLKQKKLFHLTHISLSFTVISFTPTFFYLTCKCLWISSH